MKRVLGLMLLTSALVAPAFAANISGKWQLSLPSMAGLPNVTYHLSMNQVGGVVDGNLSASDDEVSTGSPVDTSLHDARIEGDAVTFYVWRGTDHPAKQFFRGTIVEDSIHFTVSGGPSYTIADPTAQSQVKPIEVIAVRER